MLAQSDVTFQLPPFEQQTKCHGAVDFGNGPSFGLSVAPAP